ncbi:hypothetical protein ABZP36_030114 [Zizania latifolia]
MDKSSFSTSSPQRGGRELQGPRPAPLKVRKDSHKIRKPPQPVQQLRQPLIIYTVSPKVIHANPAEFMSVVQHLTGHQRTTAPHPPTLQSAWPLDGALQHSPAARLAAIEQAAAQSAGADGEHGARLPPMPSVLSPLPGSLPTIPASFFSRPASALGELMSPAAPSYFSWDLFHNMQTQQYSHQN